LLKSGTWLHPFGGIISTVLPGTNPDWRILDKNTNGDLVHTDITTPNNSVVLFYGDVPADGL
jgi:hypothetical protein